MTWPARINRGAAERAIRGWMTSPLVSGQRPPGYTYAAYASAAGSWMHDRIGETPGLTRLDTQNLARSVARSLDLAETMRDNPDWVHGAREGGVSSDCVPLQGRYIYTVIVTRGSDPAAQTRELMWVPSDTPLSAREIESLVRDRTDIARGPPIAPDRRGGGGEPPPITSVSVNTASRCL